MPTSRSSASRAIVVALAVAVMAVAALATGCGPASDPNPGLPPAAAPAPATGVTSIPPPAWLPAALPPPPDGASIIRTELIEGALLSADLATEHGIVVHRNIQYEFGTGTPADVERALDHYRTALPAAGWDLTADEPLDTSDPNVTTPGHQLRADGHGYTHVTFRVQQGETTATARVAITEVDTGRKPSTHPPTIALPDWYAALPPAPPNTRRHQIRIVTDLGAPTAYLVEYDDRPPAGDQHNRANVLAIHYRNTLPTAGWAVHDQQDSTEQSGAVQRHHITLDISGHGVAGTIHTSHTTSTSGQWLNSTVAIHIDVPQTEPATTPSTRPQPGTTEATPNER
jgi:hypothetical protein